MNRNLLYGLCAVAAVSVTLVSSRSAMSAGGQSGALVRLQTSTPGSQQVGHANVSGTVRASQFIGGGVGVTGVSADLLDGLDSSAFLTGVPNPLTLSGNQSVGHIIKGTNSANTANSVGVYGVSSATAGETAGVRGDSSSPTGLGLYGRTTAPTGANYGVWGQSGSVSGTGVYGVVTTSAGTNYGVAGRTQSPSGFGIYGVNASTGTIPKPIGIFGEALSQEGTGIKGLGGNTGVIGVGSERGVEGSTTTIGSQGVFGAYDLSGFGMGVAGYSSTQAGLGLNSYGDATVLGDLVVTGSKGGYVSDTVINVGSEPLECGDVVEIIGSDTPIQGDIPVIAVRKSSSAGSRAVLGPVDCALELISLDQMKMDRKLPDYLAYKTPQYRAYKVGGAIEPGSYGRVVTLGSFKAIKVDASFGAIEAGDLLVSSSNSGYAMRSDDPKVGTVIGKALAGLQSGTGLIPVLVQSR